MFNIVELCSPVIPEPFGQHLGIGISHYLESFMKHLNILYALTFCLI